VETGVVEKRAIFCTSLFVAVVTRKPPYGAQRHSSMATMPVDAGKRNPTYVSHVPSSMQRGDWSSARNASSNVNNRYGRAVLSSNLGSSFDRPSHSYAAGVSQTLAEDGWVHGTSLLPGTSSYSQTGTAVTGRPANGRPRSAVGIGTPHPTTSAQLPRSRTLAANLSSSSAITGCSYHRPLPPANSSSTRRSLPYTAHRT